MEGYVSTSEVALALEKSEATIKRWCREFKLSYYPNGKGGYWVEQGAQAIILKELVKPAEERASARKQREEAKALRKQKAARKEQAETAAALRYGHKTPAQLREERRKEREAKKKKREAARAKEEAAKTKQGAA